MADKLYCQDQPYPHTPPKYGAKVQYAEEVKDSPPLNKEEQRYIQKVTGTFLYLARAVDSTMLTPLGAIASEQAKPTQATEENQTIPGLCGVTRGGSTHISGE
jgi:hypothetical protein